MHLCGGDTLLTGTDPKECQKQLKKQKNRVAAQRSRQKHTDKADALHQQHESLEKDNHALQKEIQALQAELAWWTRFLHAHELQCQKDCTLSPAPLPTGCWGQAEPLPGQPTTQGPHGCQGRPGPCQTPGSSPPAQQLSPGPLHQVSPALLPSPLPALSLGPPVVTAPPAQLAPSPVLPALPSGLLESSSNLRALLLSPPAQPAPPQPLGLEHPTRGMLGSPHSPPAALGPVCLQSREHKPEVPAADWRALAVDPSAPALLAFPLLSSAQVHF